MTDVSRHASRGSECGTDAPCAPEDLVVVVVPHPVEDQSHGQHQEDHGLPLVLPPIETVLPARTPRPCGVYPELHTPATPLISSSGSLVRPTASQTASEILEKDQFGDLDLSSLFSPPASQTQKEQGTSDGGAAADGAAPNTEGATAPNTEGATAKGAAPQQLPEQILHELVSQHGRLEQEVQVLVSSAQAISKQLSEVKQKLFAFQAHVAKTHP